MGAQESTLSNFDGFQVVRVSQGSPAHRAGLVPFFDFICAVDDLVIMQDNNRFFFDYVSRNVDKPVRFRVFNLRVRAEREVVMTPSAWGGKGLLGCNVNWNAPQAALESTWHITDVAPASPAFAAGIVGMRDYLVGMQAPEGVGIALFRDNGDFHARLEQWRIAANASAHATLLLLLFDAANNEVREALLEFSANGGRRVADVSLGVEVANGYLHVVPLTPGSPDVPKVGQLVKGASPPVTPVSELPPASSGPSGPPVALPSHATPAAGPADQAASSPTETPTVLAAPATVPTAPAAPAVAAVPVTFPPPPQPSGPANAGLPPAPFALPPFPMPASFPAPPFAPISSS